MQRIINGRRYNTATAEEITTLTCRANRGDFEWHSTSLYRTPKGRWFLAGEGGARSMWATSFKNGSGPGDGIRPLTDDEAREILERENAQEALEKHFSETIEDA
jgi:hypothetical protein